MAKYWNASNAYSNKTQPLDESTQWFENENGIKKSKFESTGNIPTATIRVPALSFVYCVLFLNCFIISQMEQKKFISMYKLFLNSK